MKIFLERPRAHDVGESMRNIQIGRSYSMVLIAKIFKFSQAVFLDGEFHISRGMYGITVLTTPGAVVALGQQSFLAANWSLWDSGYASKCLGY